MCTYIYIDVYINEFLNVSEHLFTANWALLMEDRAFFDESVHTLQHAATRCNLLKHTVYIKVLNF